MGAGAAEGQRSKRRRGGGWEGQRGPARRSNRSPAPRGELSPNDPSNPRPLCTDRSPQELPAGWRGRAPRRPAWHWTGGFPSGSTPQKQGQPESPPSLSGKWGQVLTGLLGEEAWAAYHPCHLHGRCVPMSLTFGHAPAPSGCSLGHQSLSLGTIAGLGHPSRVLSQALLVLGPPPRPSVSSLSPPPPTPELQASARFPPSIFPSVTLCPPRGPRLHSEVLQTGGLKQQEVILLPLGPEV